MSKRVKTVLFSVGCIIGLIACFIIFQEWHLKSLRNPCINRMLCGSNLKSIGLDLWLYASENSGKYPDKLSVLYPNYSTRVEVFFYSDEKKKIMTPENIDSLGCFRYVEGRTLSADDNPLLAYEKSSTILAYEISNNHWIGCEESWHVLFGDGHVELFTIKAPLAVDTLIATLKDNDTPSNVRCQAICILGMIKKDARAVEPLIAALKDENRDVRCSAVWALGALKEPRAVEPLITALKDKDEYVRTQAAGILEVIKAPRAAEP